MENLNTIIAVSRFVTVAKADGGITIEANCWLSQEEIQPYTVNVRGWGKTLDNAAAQTILKMNLIGIKLEI